MTQPELPPGYTQVRTLGSSALSEVFLVANEDGRRFALKLLRRSIAKDPRILERFRREAELLAELRHPNLVQGHGTLQADGRPGLLLEFIEGASLRDALQESSLGWEQVARYGVQVARALEMLHRKGILHRDVKPHNILLDATRGAVLADLGLVRRMEDPELTRPGAALGSPAYMSPEQARDPSGVSEEADVYSLGATLHHALSGCPPFLGKGVGEVIHRVLHLPPEPLPDTVPLPLMQVLGVAMAKEAGHRYSRARDLGTDLGRVLLGYPPRLLTRVHRQKRFRQALVASTGAAFLAIGLWMFWPASSPEPSDVKISGSSTETSEIAEPIPRMPSPIHSKRLLYDGWAQPFEQRFENAFAASTYRRAAEELDAFLTASLPQRVSLEDGLLQRRQFVERSRQRLRARAQEILVETSLFMQQGADAALQQVDTGDFLVSSWQMEMLQELQRQIPLSQQLPILAGDESPEDLVRSYALDLDRHDRQHWEERSNALEQPLIHEMDHLLRTEQFSVALERWGKIHLRLRQRTSWGKQQTYSLQIWADLQNRYVRKLEASLGMTLELPFLNRSRSGRILLPREDEKSWRMEQKKGPDLPLSLFEMNPQSLLDDLGYGGRERAWLLGYWSWLQGSPEDAIRDFERLGAEVWPDTKDPWAWAQRWRQWHEAEKPFVPHPITPPFLNTAPPPASLGTPTPLPGVGLKSYMERWRPHAIVTQYGDAFDIQWSSIQISPSWSPALARGGPRLSLSAWSMTWTLETLDDFPEALSLFRNIHLQRKGSALTVQVESEKMHGFTLLPHVPQELSWKDGELFLDGIPLGSWEAPKTSRIQVHLTATHSFQPTLFRLRIQEKR